MEDFKVKQIFPNHIYGEDYLGLDENYLTQLKSSIELVRRGNIDGKSYSNSEFGWQSNDLPQSGPFEKLTQKITKKAFEFCKKIDGFDFNKVSMGSLWANINYKGDINWPHKHDGDIAGVYYLETPQDCGSLVLCYYNYNANAKLTKFLDRNKSELNIIPKKDKIVLFDSSCIHRVTKNNSEKIRMSFSFNLIIGD